MSNVSCISHSPVATVNMRLFFKGAVTNFKLLRLYFMWYVSGNLGGLGF